MIIIPAIDLKSGACVRLTQGEKQSVKVYDRDPVEVARAYAKDGAEWIHLVDLDGAFTGGATANLEIVARIVREVGVSVEFGGGVRTMPAIEALARMGVGRIILGTVAVEEPQLLRMALDRFADRVVVGIDARDGLVATRGWQQITNIDAVEFARNLKAQGLERVIYTDISQDGMLTGPNYAATQRLALESGLKVTASGGVGSLEHLLRLKREAGAVDSCIVGKALYEGRFTLREALEACL